MKGTVSRRVFVGSVAAALPLVASASGDSLTKAPTGQPHRHSAASEVPDVMYDHAIRRVAAILNRVRRNGVTAEDARLMAAHFGTLAIYAQQTDIDGRMTSAIRDLVGGKGHGDVDLAIDVARARATLKRYGVDVDDRWFDVPRPDRRTQQKALDELSHLGVSGMFARIASRFERTATELDRRGGVARMKLVQDDSWRTQFCEVLWVQVIAMSAESAAACAAMIFMPQFDAPCVLAQMSYMALLSAYYALCF
jgi:hypothetical protein